ncbi:dynamin family protein [Pseudogemmobacter bohemicus]|uniref:dynamin family protein n=1 Tax=Pseudogemmobacter bohemicus TaxID=2250708 RepID=UPI000DD45BED|nr:dynamin family protein [Pseudogemmobacter bohemicus]
MQIAPNQRQELNFLRDSLDGIDKVVSREMRAGFRVLRERLDNWAAKVAVIGQVKAGKSTFLNSFLYSHDFLPSDVNPWTSVVTNIRVNLPGDPVMGAKFEFFGEADWNEIVNGDSRIRKLTEQLLPGFDTHLLREQSEQMRQRAEERLGKRYADLLGTTHDYDYISSELLKSYVCAGAEDETDPTAAGRYAMLTRVANVYMRLPEFQVPTIITDTPGVNDPFLVRDEFTCRSLDKSDVFVIVLSAHQPLTDVDIALIRILAKQDNKDVLVFVNRIDELDDYDTDVPRVIEDVSQRLCGAIPDIDFTIVAGSAWMADLTLQDGPEAEADRAALDDTRLARYIHSRYGYLPDDRCERLMLASGMRDVKLALSQLIDSGVGRSQMAQIKADIRAELNGALFVARRERASLQTQMGSVNSEVANMAIEDLQVEIDAIRKVQSELEGHVENAEAQIEKVLTKAWSRLETRLIGMIESFIEDQKPEFEARIMAGKLRGETAKAMEIDLSPLQKVMERELTSAWKNSRAGTDVVLSNGLSSCQQTIKDRFQERTEGIDLSDLPYDEFASTLTLAKRSLRVNFISNRSWAFWRKPGINVEKSLAALRMIAAEELRPPMEKLLAAFNEAQVERAGAGIDRIRVMLRMFEVSLNERVHRLKKDMVEFEMVVNDPDFRRRIVHRLQSQMEVLERRLINLSAVESALAQADVTRAAAAA